MLTTLFASLILFAAIIIANAAILLAIALLLRAPKPNLAASAIIAFVNPFFQVLILAGLFATYEQGTALPVIIVCVGLIVAVVIPAILIRRFFAAKWGKTMAIYFLWGVCGSLFNLVIAFGLRTVVLETFYIPTNGMAPTIAGVHRFGICPHCGERVFVSTSTGLDGQLNSENTQGICESCWKSVDALDIDAKVILGDRFISNKLCRPKRWDAVTFYAPNAPGVLYVQRIVGLPGETVLIKGGQILINGVPQFPPSGLDHLLYADSEEMSARNGFESGLEFGVNDKPCQLAAGECFVLGDNTYRSGDSRFFGPVKMDQITGVVTMCYWPPSRMRDLTHSTQPHR